MPGENFLAGRGCHHEGMEEVVMLDDGQPQSFEQRSKRIEHHELRAYGAKVGSFVKDRSKENPKDEHDLDDVLHVAEKEIGTTEEQSCSGCENE